MAHSVKGPSGFSALRACPGKLRMEQGLPDKENVHAARGTAAHALGEKCLLTGAEPEQFRGQKFGEFTHPDGRVEEFIVDGDMIEDVGIYVDYCRQIKGLQYKVEQKVQLPFIGEGVSGTADFISLQDGILHVVDYKNGFGIVEAHENIQGICYGLGAANEMEESNWHTLRITIVQPNAFHHLGAVRYWDMSRDEVLDWKMDLASASLAADDPNAPLIPGKQCQWCKAKNVCSARAKDIEETLGMDFNDPKSKPMSRELLTDEEIINLVFNKVAEIKKWCGDLEDYAQKRAEEKNPLPGSKLVETRQVRMWADPITAEATLCNVEGAYEKKFKTAPQMEKLLGKKRFGEIEHLVKKVSTGVTLVPESDPRPSARPSGSSEFGAINTDINLFD